MKAVFFSAVALTLGATAAHAGSMTVPTDPVVQTPVFVAPAAHDWRGGYGGLSLTYGRAMHRSNQPAFWPDGNGAGIGGLVGYNWQHDNQVYGFEGHLGVHRMRGETTVAGQDVETDLRGIASLRGRVGIANNRTLFFVTGGPAYGSVRHTAPGLGSESSATWGAMLGVGVEQAMSNAWSIRGDLEYYAFRDQDFTTGGMAFPDVRTTATLARVSAVFRF